LPRPRDIEVSTRKHDMLAPDIPIEDVPLRGARIALEPLSAAHLPGLAVAIQDGKLWEIPVTAVPHPDDLSRFLGRAEARHAAQLERTFVTVDVASGAIVGSTRFMNINREHRRVEIGFTFIARSWQRTYVNTEAKYLMLRYAFETWGCNRVEFITDVLNEKSRMAIRRLGAKEEGVLRNHMIMRDGRLRDSVIHSVVKDEWPLIKNRLEVVLAAEDG
jgi:RimJ/RimL family protein N-acetyltransferase